MTARPWYSLGHMVRMLAADLLLGMVAVALLVCNLRGDHAIVLPLIVHARYSEFGWSQSDYQWEHGWPLVSLTRLGAEVYDPITMGGMFYRPKIPRLPRPTGPRERYELRFLALGADIVVGLLVLCSTAYATRRWLRTGTKPFQFTLLSLLILPAVPLAVYMLGELPGLVPHVLLAAFLWVGIACTVYVAAFVVAKLSRRLFSRGA